MKKFVLCALAILILFSVPLTAAAKGASLSFSGPVDARSASNETQHTPVAAQSEEISYDLLPYLVSILFAIAVLIAVMLFYVKNRRIAAVPVASLSEKERLERLIKRLDELKRHFIITDEEFQKKRNELLDRKQR